MDVERFDQQFTLHMSKRQKALLKKAAKKRKLSLGGLIRELIDGLEEN